ncbi:MAG TPA: DNA polymerase III subunit chi [Candidatus Sulfotelmatobacter sp.]|jgi:DNA polymerase-3 subunit chi|nr:DNA polymerase III subunit chi [Candidatus Sulfotelmatobacter sp.]
MSTPRIGFYHLVEMPLEQALPRLLEKVTAAGHKVVIMAGSEQRVGFLDGLLWTWNPDSWLPHGTRRDGDAELHPIWLTDGEDNANGADVLVLTDGVAPASLEGYARILNMFDGRDDQLVETAREQWRRWKADGLELVYYQQTETGGWFEKAKAGGESASGD